MLKLVDKARKLVFEILHFFLALVDLLFGLLDLVGLLVDCSIEFLCSVQSFRRLKFQGANLALQLLTLLSCLIALGVEPFDFLEVLVVTISDQLELLLAFVFLAQKVSIQLLALSQFMLESLDFRVPISNLLSLPIEFSLQVAVLVPSFIMNSELFIDLRAQGLNQPNV